MFFHLLINVIRTYDRSCRTETLGGIVKKWYGELNEDILEYQKQVTHTHHEVLCNTMCKKDESCSNLIKLTLLD